MADGSDTGFPAILDPATLDAAQGLVLTNASVGGAAVVGDLDGDGFAEVAVGDAVIFGSDALRGGIDVTALDPRDGFRLLTPHSHRLVYHAAGDVNGDGFEDLVVGNDRAQEAYVLFGAADLGASGSIDLPTLGAPDGFRIPGHDAYAVGGGGDVNGDGFDDVIVGAFSAIGTSTTTEPGGETYVIFGGPDVGASGVVDPAKLGGSDGFIVQGKPDERWLGVTVAIVGDVNGDGYDDIVTTNTNNSGESSRTAYLIFGTEDFQTDPVSNVGERESSEVAELSFSDVTGEFNSPVAGVGDVNGDGIDDLLLGALDYLGDDNGVPIYGQAYVLFGQRDLGAAGPIDLGALDGTDGFRVPAPGTALGGQVGGAGDINEDGLADMVLGGGYWREPSTYVVFGSADAGAGAVFDLRSLDGSNGFRFLDGGASGGYGGVGGGGDVNGDGVDDVLFGSVNGWPTDTAYVVYGGPPASSETVTVAFVSEEGVMNNLFGWYDPGSGAAGVVIPDAKPAAAGVVGEVAVPAGGVEWFLVPDGGDAFAPGGSLCCTDPLGLDLVVVEQDGRWMVTLDDGTPLEGRKHSSQAPEPLAYFSETGKNPDGFDHVRESAVGEQAWENLWGGGDRDFNDLVVRTGEPVTVEVVGEDAAFANLLGWYDTASGAAEVLLTDANGAVGSAFDLLVPADERLALFLVPDGGTNFRTGGVFAGEEAADLDWTVVERGGRFVVAAADGRVLEGRASGHGTPEALAYFSETAKNPDGADHLAPIGDGWGFEDLWGGGDQDFDDLVLTVTSEAEWVYG